MARRRRLRMPQGRGMGPEDRSADVQDQDASETLTSEVYAPASNRLFGNYDFYDYDYGQVGLSNQGVQQGSLRNKGLLGTNNLLAQGQLNQGNLRRQQLLRNNGLLGQAGLGQLQQQPQLQNSLYNQQLLQNRLFNDYGGGGYGGGGGVYSLGSYCQEDQVNIGILLITVAGIGIMFYTVLTKIQANGGRRLLKSTPVLENLDKLYASKSQQYL